jgi:hypothetical protein
MAKRPDTRARQLELPVMAAVGPRRPGQGAHTTAHQQKCSTREATPQDKSVYEAISSKYLASLKR